MTGVNLIADIAQKAIIKNDDKILLIRPIGKQVWEIPGGRLLEGENPKEGIRREIREELGLKIEPIRVADTFVLIEKNPPHHFTVVWCCDLQSDAANLKKEDAEIEEIKWVKKEEINNLVFYREHKNILNRFFTED